MKRWSTLLGQRGAVAKLNTSLFASLTHCPTLEAFGLSFRCVECHVAGGTLHAGEIADWHLHQEYQLEVPLSGAFLFESEGGRRVTLRPGHALVIPAQVAHRWKCLRPGPLIGISLDLLASPEIGRGGAAFGGFATASSAVLRMRADELIEGALDKVPAAFQSKAVASRLFLLLAEIFTHLHPGENPKAVARTKPGGDIRGRESVGQVISYLEANYGQRIRLAQLAEDIGMSGRHLHRLFLQCVGKSVHDHLLDLRLEHARQLLMEKGRKYLVKEIASRCGFSSTAYFSSAFGKAYGVSPLAYRAKRGGGRRCFTIYLRSDRKEASALSRKRAKTPRVPR